MAETEQWNREAVSDFHAVIRIDGPDGSWPARICSTPAYVELRAPFMWTDMR